MMAWFVSNWRGVLWWLALVALPSVLVAVRSDVLPGFWLFPMIGFFFVALMLYWWLP